MLVLFAALLLSSVSVFAAELKKSEGDWNGDGFNVTWKLENAELKGSTQYYTLTLSGTGDLPDETLYLINQQQHNSSHGSVEPWADADGKGDGRFCFEKISHLVIGEGITGIGANVFTDYQELIDVQLPTTLKKIGNNAFYRDWSIIKIFPTGTNEAELAEGSLILPDGVETIGEDAFSHLYGYFYKDTANITLTLPANLKSIGDGAFSYNEYLQKVIIPAGLQEITGIEIWGSGGVFDRSLHISEFQVASGMQVIPAYMLSGDYGYHETEITVTLPDTIEEVGDCAFAGMKKLTSINLKDCEKLTEIGQRAFVACNDLSTSDLLPYSITTIGDGAFANCGFTKIVLPSKLELVGDNIFNSCASLKTVEFAEGIKRIPENCVNSANTAITKIVLPDGVEEIGKYAFANNTSLPLTGINLPASIKKIEEGAFLNCTKFEGTLKLPEGLEALGAQAFYRCTSLAGVEIPAALTTAGEGTFVNCDSLKKVTMADGLKRVPDGLFGDYSSKIESVVFAGTETEIGKNAFSGCTYLAEAALPDTVTVIDAGAFAGCTALAGDLALPKALETIGDGAYKNCSALTAVTFPASLKTVGSKVFEGCGKLTEVTIAEGTAAVPDGLLESASAVKKVTMPDTVTTIGTRAFSGLVQLNEIKLPGTVTGIGDEAFYGCALLSDEEFIPDSVTAIGDRAFALTGFKRILIPSGLETVGKRIFYGNNDLTEVKFRSGTTKIAAGVLDNAKEGEEEGDYPHITIIDIPEGTTEIGARAFAANTYLENIVLPEGLLSIGDEAFAGCTGLYSVSFPEGLSTIGEKAFAGDTWLVKLSLPGGLTVIGKAAFAGCTALTNVTLPNTLTTVADDAFNGCFAGSESYKVLYAGTEEDFYSLVTVGSGNSGMMRYLTFPESYAIIYKLDGGDFTRVVRRAYMEGESFTFAAPVKTGYVFDGWFKNAALTIPKPGIESYDTGELTIYAKWHPITYTIHFVPNYTYTGEIAEKIEDIEAVYDEVTEIPRRVFTRNDEVRDGKRYRYKQTAWNTVSSPTDDVPGITVARDSREILNLTTVDKATVTLYAVWQERSEDSGFTVELEDQEKEWIYTGKALSPAIVVYSGLDVLNPGTDYTVKYTNNTKASTGAKIAVTGKGAYAGSKASATFTIKPRSMDDVAAAHLVVKRGSKAVPVLIYAGKKLTTADYTFAAASDKTKLFTESGTIVLNGKGNFDGEKVVAVDVNDTGIGTKINVRLSQTSVEYTGMPIEPEYKVTGASAAELVEGVDYEVSGLDGCINAGTYKFAVVGIGEYTGSVVKGFKITPVKSSSMQTQISSAVKEYSSLGVTLTEEELGVEWDGDLLSPGVDYKVTYKKNNKAGQAKATVKFLGNFKGSKTVSANFTIESTTLITGGVTPYIPGVFFKQGACAANIYAVDENNTLLKKGKDYTVSFYRDQSLASEVTKASPVTEADFGAANTITLWASLKGKGNYGGTGDSNQISAGYIVTRSEAAVNIPGDIRIKVTGTKSDRVYAGAPVNAAYTIERKSGGSWSAMSESEIANKLTVIQADNRKKGKGRIIVIGSDPDWYGAKLGTFSIGIANPVWK